MSVLQVVAIYFQCTILSTDLESNPPKKQKKFHFFVKSTEKRFYVQNLSGCVYKITRGCYNTTVRRPGRERPVAAIRRELLCRRYSAA